MRRDFIEGDDDDSRRVRDDSRVSFDRIAEEKGDGARDRDTSRTINGALEQVPCQDGLSCEQDRCMRRDTPSRFLDSWSLHDVIFLLSLSCCSCMRNNEARGTRQRSQVQC